MTVLLNIGACASAADHRVVKIVGLVLLAILLVFQVVTAIPLFKGDRR